MELQGDALIRLKKKFVEIWWWSEQGRGERERDLAYVRWIVCFVEFRIGEMAAAAVDGASKTPPAPSPFRSSKLTTVRGFN